MIRKIKELNLPSYATLSQATVTKNEMGERTIETQINIDEIVVPDFSYDWELEFDGEKYIQPYRIPQGAVGETLRTSFDLTFYHWAVWQLKRYYFVELTSVDSDTAIADKYIDTVALNLNDFVVLLNRVLNYWYGGKIQAVLNPAWEYDTATTGVEISYTYIWDLLQNVYELYAVRWDITHDASTDVYYICFGYTVDEISHIFENCYEGGLLKIERNVQDADIKNVVLGRGGDKNLPYRYYKDVDPDNTAWEADPDWIPELANIYFSELRGKAFRDYVRGWKAKHYNGTDYADKTDAYMKGYTDLKFDPIEYVKDDASIAKYGEIWGALENNEDIYPSIQGVEVSPYGRVDEAVDVEQITTDTVENISDTDVYTVDTNFYKRGTSFVFNHESAKYPSDEDLTITVKGTPVPWGSTGLYMEGDVVIEVPEGYHASLNYTVGITAQRHRYEGNRYEEITGTFLFSEIVFVFTDEHGTEYRTDKSEISTDYIPSGKYTVYAIVKVDTELVSDPSYKDTYSWTASLEGTTMTLVSDTADKWTNTFDIWVKNIWGTTKADDETDTEYTNRVWEKILGDHVGNEAKVVFASGFLSTSEDYEFTIIDVTYDTSKELNGVKSEWKITLKKSDADYESLGLLVPNTQRQGKPGDYFFFTGIDMPHQYVLWAEERLDAYKQDELDEVKDIKPTWTLTLDKIRLDNAVSKSQADTLLSKLNLGAALRFRNKQLTDNQEEILIINAITYTFTDTEEANNILPDVEVTLTEGYETNLSTVATLQGEVEAISKQVGALSNIKQVVTSVGDKKYLRKDTVDKTPYDLGVGGNLSVDGEVNAGGGLNIGKYSEGGLFGSGGKIDSSGNAQLRSLTLTDFLEVPELRYNQVSVFVGVQWITHGAGLIEEVIVDLDENKQQMNSGIIKLHLQEGQYGAVEVDDLCMGIFHSFTTLNATKDEDSRNMNMQFAGFCTVYFRITEILDDAHSLFRYTLRGTSDDWPYAYHPQPQMSFACYANPTNTDRQSCIYSTTKYTIGLQNMTTWTYGDANIYKIDGVLEGFSLSGKQFHGTGVVLGNFYYYGTQNSFVNAPLKMSIDTQGVTALATNESLKLTATCTKGYSDVDSGDIQWTITRETSYPEDDKTWNASEKAKSFKGEIEITYADLGVDNNIYGQTALFVITAEYDDDKAEANIII